MFFATTLFGSYELSILLKILLAVFAGGIIGFEREKHGRPAGLRTHLLVSAGSCLMMIVSEAFFLKYGDLPGSGVLRLDPSRAAAQIITGIGFLGAGVIIKEGFVVRGLTTAACLWMVAGIGMAFGMGLIGGGIIGTLVALFSLIALKKLEPIIKKDRYLHINVIAKAEPDIYPQLESILSANSLRLSNIEADWNINENSVAYRLVLTQHKNRIGRDISRLIREIEGVQKISYK
ncbi:MgtC/SapB family protein [uncultured Desulfuromusa sp.]|uniref:MgtC/SapB family protein n=1 Tax=uncultured Desulfuromusa sp. TaxID=219183 RepID=UPI002AA754D2|nr:MgtC/SapB family protein [uncultured Desulfuromusa sp.]